MKNTIQKIFITLAGLVVSFAACIIGMYMVFLADNMKFGYQMLFSAIFMFNPVTTILMAVNMFKRTRRAAPAAEKRPVEEKAPREHKKPKEIRNPFKKEPKETDSSEKESDLSDSFPSNNDAGENPFFSSENENPDSDEEDDDLFPEHITIDEEDQLICDEAEGDLVTRKRITL